MRKITLFLVLTLFTVLLKAQSSDQSEKKGPFISFYETSHDFGDITQGDKISYVFKFKNSGTDPLIISEVLTTCGCTATKWSKEPILPGKEGEIEATFNSEGKMGRQNKVITILSNATNQRSAVTIVTNVLPPKKQTNEQGN